MNNYYNLDLNISQLGGSSNLIDNVHARYYLDSGKTLVNISTPLNNISALTIGTDYEMIEEEVWLTKTYLLTNNKMIVTSNATSISIDVRDPVLIGYVDNPQVGMASTSVGIQSTTYPANMCTSSCDFTVVFVGGMLTFSSYFDDTMIKLKNKYASIGKTVNFKTVFPYGNADNTSGPQDLVTLGSIQLVKIKLDLDNSFLAVGGTKTAAVAKEAQTAAGGKLILIGHSGGGIAAYRAAQKLRSQSTSLLVQEIVNVGSPRTAIESYWQNRFTYVVADCFWGDPNTAYGTRGLFNIYRPNSRRKVQLDPAFGDGGFYIHMGYFQDRSWNNGLSNSTFAHRNR